MRWVIGLLVAVIVLQIVCTYLLALYIEAVAERLFALIQQTRSQVDSRQVARQVRDGLVTEIINALRPTPHRQDR